MRTGIIAAAAVLVLVVGTFMGVAGIFLLPAVGIIALIALVVYGLSRKADDRPPLP